MPYREIIVVCSQINTKHINTLCGQSVESLGTFTELRKETISFVESVCLSVRMGQLGSQWINFHQIWYLYFRKICRENSSFIKLKQEWRVLYMNTNIHFYHISLSSSSSKKCFRQSRGAHILCSITFFSENRAVREIMWKNTAKRGRPQMTIWRMRIACWIPKATNTHSQHVKFTVFPLQQWLHERASMLRYTYSTLPVLTNDFLL